MMNSALKYNKDFEKFNSKFGFQLTSNPMSVEIIMGALESWYKKTSNPMFIWHAIAQAKYAKIDFPTWTHPYLMDTAMNIYDLTNSASASTTSTSSGIGAAIASALGLKRNKAANTGKHGAIKEYTVLARATRLYREVTYIVANEGISEAAALKRIHSNPAMTGFLDLKGCEKDLRLIREYFDLDADTWMPITGPVTVP